MLELPLSQGFGSSSLLDAKRESRIVAGLGVNPVRPALCACGTGRWLLQQKKNEERKNHGKGEGVLTGFLTL